MASIEKRIDNNGEVHYRVKVRLKGYPVTTATFKRKTDANKWAQQTEVAMREGRHFKNSASQKKTLSEAIDRYIEVVLPEKPKSYNKQKAQLEWWRDALGDYVLADITPAVLVEQREALSKGITRRNTKRSPATVNRYLAIISHLFTICVNEWGWMDDSPSRRVSKLKEPRGIVRFLSDDERARLLRACKESSNHCLYPVVVLCLSTGARRNEILNLAWADINFKRKTIILHDTKNKDRRSIPLTAYTHKLMSDYKKEHSTGNALVFPGMNGIYAMDITRAWRNAIDKAEIKDFRFHDLRHSAASYLAMDGASIVAIAEILGHKTLQMVKRYAHLSEQHTSEVVEKMNDAIFTTFESKEEGSDEYKN